MKSIAAAFRNLWTSETSPLSLRTKQLVATVLPEPLLIALKKRYYARLLRQSANEFMEMDAAALPRFVKPGDFVIDVGAFVGFYTRSLSYLVGPSGMVWSIEPVPQTFEILTYGVRKLGLSNVRLFNCAISDSEKIVTMEVPRYRKGGESWYDARIVPNPARASLRRFEVATRTLDSLTHGQSRPVSFIKCDAEYHELYCIRGALETIRCWKPVLLVEMIWSPDEVGSDQHRIVALLRELGYAPHCFDRDGFHIRRVGEKSQNVFFFAGCHDDLIRNA